MEYITGFFKGRINRTGFLIRNVILFAVLGICGIALSGYHLTIYNFIRITGKNATGTGSFASALLGACIFFLLILCGTFFSASFSIRRLHDIDMSGWIWFVNLLPGFSLLLFIFLLIFPGNSGNNTYGAPPL